MIIMVLDHVRDLMHVSSITQSPTDLSITTPALFFTRWITHLCAPAFVFLSGASVFVKMKSGIDESSYRRHLLRRGIFLILLDLTIINFGIWFDIRFSVILFNVVAAIGVGFIALSMLTKLSIRKIALLGILILLLHNALVNIPRVEFLQPILSPLFVPATFPIGGSRLLVIGYPPIPWLGIMLLGFAGGRYFLENKEKAFFFKAGITAIILFILLRCINLYGDSSPWTVQKNSIYTILSFLNVTKYPPSLQFCLLFLGLTSLIISWLSGTKNRLTEVLSVYGKAPLFFFIIHWYIIHSILFALLYLQGFGMADMLFGFNFGRPKEMSGVPLWGVFLIWFLVVLLLYPLCKWFIGYKQRAKHKNWLRYI